MINQARNRYIIICKEKEGRSWLYHHVLENCGFDLTEGVNITGNETPFQLGQRSVGLSIYNELVEYCPDVLKTMKDEKDDYGSY